MKTPSIILGLFFVLTVMSFTQQIKGEIKVITPQEMHAFLELGDVQFVDVRTPQEHDTAFIPKSRNINFFSPTFLEDIQNLDKNKPVLLYCKSGNRSAKSAQKMLEDGFVKIYELEGGILKWKQEGFETDTKIYRLCFLSLLWMCKICIF